MDFKMGNTKNLRKESSNFASRLRDHVKGKLRLGAKIIQEGGRENIFKQKFGMAEGEEMLKASQCYLSTTAGPIAGLLFVSTEKVAFISDSLITVSSATGQSIRIPYKVMIPIRKIKRANRSENVNKPAEKYLEVVTKDCFEFWFMGFLRYEQALDSLQKALWLVDIQLTPKCRRRLFLKSA
ncbi:GEM-like protein 4 isoform X2 [Herrania umbratica]|uniref:GEM-like protein 4 isoform X2 n=1 Tax=Herrania umbratica TaxID=108875 RepID=A0A6J1AI06_9ROSI|nr:GEM-like protein 4 isoform X2 [Herrania umbratica]